MASKITRCAIRAGVLVLITLGIALATERTPDEFFVVSCADGTSKSLMPQVSADVGAICITLCRNPGQTGSCSAATSPPDAVSTRVSMKLGQELWLRVRGTGVTVFQLGKHLRSLLGWKVNIAPELDTERLREVQVRSKIEPQVVLEMTTQAGRQIEIHIDLESGTFTIRGK